MSSEMDVLLGKNTEKLQKTFNQKLCLAPESIKNGCSGKIIKAHTISKCLGLNNIALNGQVYTFSLPSQHALHENNGIVQLKKIGVQQASVLFCFCSKHDKEIFLPIEDKEFSLSFEQCFLLAYRSLVEEYYKSKFSTLADLFKEQIENGVDDLFDNPVKTPNYLDKDELKNHWKSHFIENSPILKQLDYKIRDLEQDKNFFDTVLISKNFTELNHYVFEGNATSNVVCGFSLNPEISFYNTKIQDYNSPNYLTSICVNCISKNNKSYVIFSWINNEKNNKLIENFFGELKSKNNEMIEHILLEFIFKNCENKYFSIEWFDKLNKAQKKFLTNWSQPLHGRNLNKPNHGIMFMNLQKHYLLTLN